MSRDRLFSWLIILVGIGVLMFGVWKYAGFLTDDSFISLRYAQNLLDGNGLVWNHGERVEGYSNFLFVMLVSALGFAGFDLVFASQCLGVASFLVTLGYLIWKFRVWRRDYLNNDVVCTLPALITGTAYCMIIWSFGGLETALFSFLVTVGVLTAQDGLNRRLREAVFAGFILGLATLTRPDGALFLGIASVFYFVLCVRYKTISAKRILALVVPFAVIVGAHEIWRIAYYGQLVPNTWYVKGDLSWDKIDMGWRYVVGFVVTQPSLLPLLALSLGFRAVTRTWNLRLSFLAAMIVAYTLYIVAIGGDHMLAYRPLVAVIPLTAVTIVLALEPVMRGLRGWVVGVIFLLFAIGQIVFPGRGIQGAERPDGASYCGRIVGDYIRDNWPDGSLVALNSAGATPYYARDIRFLDMLGLNDTAIARRRNIPMLLPYQAVPGHAKGDGRYVFERRPDYIIAGPSNGSDIRRARTLSEYELSRMLDFNREYRLKTVRISVTRYERFREYSETKSGEMIFTYYERAK